MKELSFEKMENLNGKWSDANTVELICAVGPWALSWCAPLAFSLKVGCVVTTGMGLMYAAGWLN